VVCIVVLNLVGIIAVVLTVMYARLRVSVFCTLGLKMPIHAPKIGSWG